MKTVNSHEFEYETLKNHRPLLSYETGDSLEEWKAKARAKLEELLGLPLERCDGEAEIEYEKDFDTHTEYRFTVETERGYHVPCHLLIPRGDKEKYPLTVCLSGHGAGMHIALGSPKNEDDEKSISS